MHRKRPSVSISFRLGAETANTLRAKADEANMTSGKYAQLLVVQALGDDFNEELADDLVRHNFDQRRLLSLIVRCDLARRLGIEGRCLQFR